MSTAGLARPARPTRPTHPTQPVTPRLYATTVRHVRREPVAHDFSTRSYTWLVDLDALPDLGRLSRLASFEARDHLDRDAPGSLRQKVDAFLATEGVDLRGGRVVMLAQARVAGHVFNPISLFWCHRADGGLECVVVEVHNTYGDRHAYLVRTDEQGRARTDKRLYVSPFNDVDGHYDLVLPEPGELLRTSVVLKRPGRPPFVAVMTGRAHDVTTTRLLTTSLRRPLEPLTVTARIKAHGIRLWLRRLPVRPRPSHRQEAVQ